MKPYNDKNTIDDLFKDVFAQQEIPMSEVNQFWERINPEKPKKRRRIFWLSLLGLGIISTLLFSTFKAKGPSDQSIEPEQLTQLKSEAIKSSSQSIEQLVSPRQNISSTNSATNIIRNEKNEPTISSNTYSKRRINSRTIVSTLTERTSVRNPNVGLQITTTPKASETNTSPILPSADKVEPHLSKLFPLHNFDNQIGFLTVPRRTLPKLTSLSFTPSLRNIKPAHTPSRWFLQSGLGVGQNTGFDFASDSDIPLSQEWNDKAQLLASYHIQLSVGRYISRRSQILLGIEYQHNEHQFIQTITTSTTEIDFNPRAYVTINGTFIGDSIAVEVIHENTLAAPISVTFFNIPVSYNYNFFQRDHCTFGASAGLILSARSQYNGPILNQDLEWIDAGQAVFTDLRFSYQLGLHFSYQFVENGFLVFNPSVRYQPGINNRAFVPASAFVIGNVGIKKAF